MMKGPAQTSSSTDLGRLWEKALEEYREECGENLKGMKASNINEVMNNVNYSMESFGASRHSGGKRDRFRQAMGDHLGSMQKCINGLAEIGAAAGAFPPAMPVGLIFTAASGLISAFSAVRAEYDRIEEFFGYSSRFFERLAICESRADSDAVAIAIVRVFSQQLTVCGRVRYLIQGKAKRMKQFFKALWEAEDEKLTTAYAAMHASIEELDQAIGFESYSAIRDVKDDMAINRSKMEGLDVKLSSFRKELGQDIQQVYAESLKLEVVIKDGFYSVNTRLDESLALNHKIAKNHEKLVESQNAMAKMLSELSRERHVQGEPRIQDQDLESNVSGGNFQAVREIKKFFTRNQATFPLWMDAHRENLAIHEDLCGSRVQNTAQWVFEHQSFKNWVDGKDPILWLKGTEGVGKSFLTQSIIENLRKRQEEHIWVAYFYFKEAFPYLQSRQNAFASSALQLADTHTKYAEQVAADLRESAEDLNDIPIWKRFFLSRFPGGEGAMDRLFLVFDGLDEAYLQPVGALSRFLRDLKRKNANISVLVTSRPEDTAVLGLLNPSVIEIKKEKIQLDIRELLKHRLQTLPRVRKFSPAIKKTIIRKVVQQADSMLYVEHMVRRFASIGRGQAVLEELEKMPRTLHDLYRLLLAECRSGRSDAQYQAIKKLFAWLAFSKRSLSLAEASSLVQLTLSDDTFDVEEEVVGRSSRILEINQPRQTYGDTVDGDEEYADVHSIEENIIPELQYRKLPLAFQDRSLRQYFTSTSIEADSETEFRTPATAAHLTILQMCIEIMLKASESSENRQSSELAMYAIQNWYEHLEDLDVKSMTDEAIQQVVTSLYSITQNQNNLAKLFERLARPTDIYPERTNGIANPWVDILVSWLARAKPRVEVSLQVEVRDWIQEVKETNILLPLARGHVQNWLNATDQMDAFESNDAEPLRDIRAIEEKRDVSIANYKAFRAFGTTLSDYAYREPNKVRQRKLMETSIVYLEQSVFLMKEDNLEKVAALRILASTYTSNDQTAHAIKSYDQAYAMLPPRVEGLSREGQKDVDDIRLNILLAKAAVYAKKSDMANALRMFNQARAVAGKQPLAGSVLDDITLLFTKDNDKDGSKLMNLLAGWTEKERNGWFFYCFETSMGQGALMRMLRAAKLANKTDTLLSWLSILASKIPANSYYLFNVKAAIATMYYPVLGDIEKGRSVRFEMLEMEPQHDSWYKDNMKAAQSEIRSKLADISFHEFQLSIEPQKKEQLIEDLKLSRNADDEESNQDDRDNTSGTHMIMLRTNMLRIMGPAIKYERYMNELFNECMRGLEDDIAWNDSRNLRLLAKVLASLDGLEKDAMIASSAQFSVLDRTLYGEDANFDIVESASDSGNIDSDANNKTKTHNKIVEVSIEPAQLVTERLMPTPVQMEESIIPISQALIDTAPASMNDYSVQVVNFVASLDDKAPTIATTSKVDEDLNGVKIGCDGGCGTFIDSWSQPFFFCLVCPNCDLCQDCHKKRLKQTAGEIPEPWLSFCGPNHRYIKAPIKSWRGIKNGVIRIDGEKDGTVKEWLDGLKKERWQKAWHAFWTRQGGLKNIGHGD
ncbi:unnamed protein product [Alternaria alternata]